ncbi:MAG: transcription antitermination factor NusB [Alphaproteobacteria bacterium]|jgi:N utilization substance protein B
MRGDDLIQQFAPGAEPVGEETDARPLEGLRRMARVATIQVLYQSAMTNAEIGQVARQFEEHRLGENIDGLTLKADKMFFRRLTSGIMEEAPALTLLVQDRLQKRQVGRLEYVLQAILMTGAFELQTMMDVPARSTIDEYTEIAAAFFDDGERGLVNAVLDRIARELRPDDFAAA